MLMGTLVYVAGIPHVILPAMKPGSAGPGLATGMLGGMGDGGWPLAGDWYGRL